MSLADHDALCIRHWDYSETSQTVSLFCREVGLVRAIAKGSRRERGSFGGGVDLLTRGVAGLSIRKGRDLSTFGRWQLTTLWPCLRTDLRRNQAAFLCADVTGRLVMPHDPHPAVFDGLIDALDSLQAGDSIDAAIARFLWCLLGETGHGVRLPSPLQLCQGAEFLRFHPHDGGFNASDGGGPAWPVRVDTVRALVALLTHQAGDEAHASLEESHPGCTTRAARLLAAHVREVVGQELPTIPALYPEIAGTQAMATITGWPSPTAQPRSQTGSASTPRSIPRQ